MTLESLNNKENNSENIILKDTLRSINLLNSKIEEVEKISGDGTPWSKILPKEGVSVLHNTLVSIDVASRGPLFSDLRRYLEDKAEKEPSGIFVSLLSDLTMAQEVIWTLSENKDSILDVLKKFSNTPESIIETNSSELTLIEFTRTESLHLKNILEKIKSDLGKLE